MDNAKAPNKPLLMEFAGERPARPPFWFMRQAGRYLPEYQRLRREAEDFLRFCYTPDLTIEAALQPLRRYRMDGAILFSDILVIPDAMGCDVRFVEGRGPVLEPIRDRADLDRLRVGGLEDRLSPVFRSVSGLAQAIPDGVTLIGFAGAPWTVAVYMVEGCGGTEAERAKAWAYRDPAGFGGLVDRLVQATVWYLIRQIEAGVELVQLFDSWAGRLSENQFRRWVIEPTRTIVDQVRARFPHIPIIGFPRGCGFLYQDYVEGTGVDGVSLDAAVPPEWAAANLQGSRLVQGNLDNVVLLADERAIERETLRILNILGPGRFVFNLGHGVLPETPPEHLALVADTVRSWRRR
jgi:uroporphyrinogen decarboxylase